MKLRVLTMILSLVISILPLNAQRTIGGGCGGIDPPPPPPPPPPVTCPTSIAGSNPSTGWGFYNWQVDLKPSTTTLGSETDFSSNPGGLVRIAVPTTGSLPCTVTVHEIHGNVALEAQQGGSCSVNSIVAQVLDQNGNAIAGSSLIVFGPGHTNVPIKGTFTTPLSVTSFSLVYSLSPGCVSVLSWDLVMS
jgi:hypothetical protein